MIIFALWFYPKIPTDRKAAIAIDGAELDSDYSTMKTITHIQWVCSLIGLTMIVLGRQAAAELSNIGKILILGTFLVLII